MKRWQSKLLAITGWSLFALFLVGYVVLSIFTYSPYPIMEADTVCRDNAPRLSASEKSLRVLSWNVQYAASRKYHFFYDGGKDVIAERVDVENTLQQMIEVVRRYDPDIILWQEIDRESDRTQRIDQIAALWDALPAYKCRTGAPYFKSLYIPFPPHEHMGRMDMHLSTFSKYKLHNGLRFALPMLDENFLRRAFNLKRAVISVEMPVEGGGAVHLFNTHLSAFSRGDGTMAKQIAKMKRMLEIVEEDGEQWIAGGDLNLLPPGDDPKRLGASAASYSDAINPIEPMFEHFKSALPLDEYRANPDKYNTYVSFGNDKTDRWIDYVFVSDDITVSNYQVPQEHINISDHLPIVVEMQLP